MEEQPSTRPQSVSRHSSSWLSLGTSPIDHSFFSLGAHRPTDMSPDEGRRVTRIRGPALPSSLEPGKRFSRLMPHRRRT